MKINILESKIIGCNDDSLHNYWGWPTITRLKDGRLAIAASGFRLGHICPFGKCVVMFSADEGKTWSLPTPVIDTPLDDRDGGITAFGESSLIVTSFNNSLEFQHEHGWANDGGDCAYANKYLDFVEQKCPDWRKYVGSTYRISHDNGVTYGPIMKMPVTCPHGPTEMPDGTLLYIGRKFSDNDQFREGEKHLSCYKMYADGSYELLSEIENADGINSCEPHTIITSSGKIIVHIRMEGNGYFSIWQSESTDGGNTFTAPHALLSQRGGSPAHIIEHNGTLVSVYGYRNEPYGIRVMFSKDDGETWDTDNVLVDDGTDGDLGYPASVILPDGNILTIFYFKRPDNTCIIRQVIWNYSEE